MPARKLPPHLLLVARQGRTHCWVWLACAFNVMENHRYNETIGGPELCAWQPVANVVWVQTRDPKHAAKLCKRADSREVARSPFKDHLRTFEFIGKELAWAKRLIGRCTGDLTAPNEPLHATHGLRQTLEDSKPCQGPLESPEGVCPPFRPH